MKFLTIIVATNSKSNYFLFQIFVFSFENSKFDVKSLKTRLIFESFEKFDIRIVMNCSIFKIQTKIDQLLVQLKIRIFDWRHCDKIDWTENWYDAKLIQKNKRYLKFANNAILLNEIFKTMWKNFEKHVIWKSWIIFSNWKFHDYQFFDLFNYFFNSIKSKNNFWKCFWHDSIFYVT